MKKLIKSLLLTALLMSSIQSQAGIIVGGWGLYFAASGVIEAQDGSSMAGLSYLKTIIGTPVAIIGGVVLSEGIRKSGTGGAVLLVLDEDVNQGFFNFIDEDKVLGTLESTLAKEYLADTLAQKFDEDKESIQELKLTNKEFSSLCELEGILETSSLGQSLSVELQ